MSDIVCPRRIVRPSDQERDDKPAVIPLPPYKNTANLSNIVCNSREPVLLRLLVCKEQKEDNQGKCPFTDHPYTGHINDQSTNQLCNEPKNKMFTQIYFRHEKMDKKARSCVVVFIEGDSLHKTDVLLEKFQNTIQWLKIAEEMPFFHVVYYGEPLFDNDNSKAYNELNIKMRAIYSQYSKDEDICFFTYANSKAKVLILNYTTTFSVKAS